MRGNDFQTFEEPRKALFATLTVDVYEKYSLNCLNSTTITINLTYSL